MGGWARSGWVSSGEEDFGDVPDDSWDAEIERQRAEHGGPLQGMDEPEHPDATDLSTVNNYL